MPYKSRAQAAYMHINHPNIAKRWDKEYPHQGKLPEHVKKKKVKKASEDIRTLLRRLGLID
jgi:hypothetical protein